MRNYKLTIAYDGSRFSGWQRQVTTDLTIQGMLEEKISDVLGYRVEIDGSGRTDGGVHAKGQVANVKIAGKLDEGIFRSRINEQLPEDIRIMKVELVKNNFHSRLSAKGKTYEYSIDRGQKPHVFTRKYSYHYPKSLNIDDMEKAIGYLIGTHDFASFCDKKDEKSSTRTIYDITLDQHRDKMKIVFYGNGFLYHMVRILTGTLLAVGTGEIKVDEIPAIIDAKERALAGFLVPAQGLCLMEVTY